MPAGKTIVSPEDAFATNVSHSIEPAFKVTVAESTDNPMFQQISALIANLWVQERPLSENDILLLLNGEAAKKINKNEVRMEKCLVKKATLSCETLQTFGIDKKKMNKKKMDIVHNAVEIM